MTEQAFAGRAHAARKQLYRTALLYLGSEAMALDAVDEAVYKGLCAAHTLREETYFTTWLTRILINVCNTELRRRKREITLAELPETAQEEFDALPLKDAVTRLPRDLRSVIVLRYFSGLTLSETAEALDIPPGTVSTRQRKALDLLRLELTDEKEVGA
ncbi:MAG: sigma-70 family RNA polymerase sigma factor [Clostridia bacterium]|nr:sigma-70 family RNA polymerase sigma factor [Clostridia bacterium]